MPEGNSHLLMPPAVVRRRGYQHRRSGVAAQLERVEKGIAALRMLGFSPALGKNALHRGPLYFAGTAEQRIGDFHAAFADDNTAAVMCLRGGYGSNYILDALDLDLIRTPSQSILRLQRSDRRATAPAR